MMLESLYQLYGPQRLSEDIDRHDSLRPDNIDDDNDAMSVELTFLHSYFTHVN